MLNYEFRLVGGDGFPLRREFHALDSLESVWSRILEFATSAGGVGKQIQALDADGGIVIGIGIKAAAHMAARRKPTISALSNRLTSRRSSAPISRALTTARHAAGLSFFSPRERSVAAHPFVGVGTEG